MKNKKIFTSNYNFESFSIYQEVSVSFLKNSASICIEVNFTCKSIETSFTAKEYISYSEFSQEKVDFVIKNYKEIFNQRIYSYIKALEEFKSLKIS